MVKMVANIHTKIVYWLVAQSIADGAPKIDNSHAVGSIPTAITRPVFEDAI